MLCFVETGIHRKKMPIPSNKTQLFEMEQFLKKIELMFSFLFSFPLFFEIILFKSMKQCQYIVICVLTYKGENAFLWINSNHTKLHSVNMPNMSCFCHSFILSLSLSLTLPIAIPNIVCIYSFCFVHKVYYMFTYYQMHLTPYIFFFE